MRWDTGTAFLVLERELVAGEDGPLPASLNEVSLRVRCICLDSASSDLEREDLGVPSSSSIEETTEVVLDTLRVMNDCEPLEGTNIPLPPLRSDPGFTTTGEEGDGLDLLRVIALCCREE